MTNIFLFQIPKILIYSSVVTVMRVSEQEEVNGHLFTYVKGEELDGEVLAGVTAYSSGAQFFSEDIDYDIAENVEASRYSENLDTDIEAYPLDRGTVEDIAEGVRDRQLPLSDGEVKKMLGEMTDSEKAEAKMDFFY